MSQGRFKGILRRFRVYKKDPEDFKAYFRRFREVAGAQSTRDRKIRRIKAVHIKI